MISKHYTYLYILLKFVETYQQCDGKTFFLLYFLLTPNYPRACWSECIASRHWMVLFTASPQVWVYVPYSFGTTGNSKQKKTVSLLNFHLFVSFCLVATGSLISPFFRAFPPRPLGPRTSKQPLRSAFQFCLEHELVDCQAGMSDKCEENPFELLRLLG